MAHNHHRRGRSNHQIQEEPGYTTNYTYDALDDLLTVQQSVQTRTFGYDGLKRLTCAANPESSVAGVNCASHPASGADLYKYDNNGNLSTHTDANNVATTSLYDKLNRVIQKTYSDGLTPTAVFCYDGSASATSVSGTVVSCGTQSSPAIKGTNSGRRLTWEGNSGAIGATNFSSSNSFTAFDSVGRVQSHTQVTNGASYPFSYLYNLAGQLKWEQYPSGRQVSTCYDGAGWALQVLGQSTTYASGGSEYQPPYVGLQYGLDGQLASAAFGIVSGSPAVSETRNYSLDRLQLTGITATNGQGTELLALGFTWGGLPTYNNTPGNNGNLQQQTIQVPAVTHTQQYGYDTANRILSANESEQLTYGGTTHPWGMTFGFDPYGNHWSSTTGITLSPSGPTSQSQFNPSNNPLLADGYDTAGHLTSDPNLGNVTYYAEGKQYTVTNSGNVGTYYYDAEGRRVQKLVSGTVSGTATYVYDAAGQLTAEYSNSSGHGCGHRHGVPDGGPFGQHAAGDEQLGPVRGQVGLLPLRRPDLEFGRGRQSGPGM